MGEQFKNDHGGIDCVPDCSLGGEPLSLNDLLSLHPDREEIMEVEIQTQRCIYDLYGGDENQNGKITDCPHSNTRTIAINGDGTELLICPRKDRYERCLRQILKLS